ncbi:MAG: sensor histidine kinase [Clostridia bacterium]|nr:sensor histidine kinase [Clostridia bacterium]
MKELSLHILDIVQNSVKAKADKIDIIINENIKDNLLEITISDNGCGMSEDFLKTVKDPFSTTRTTRKVGMGISLFEAAAIQSGGHLDIKSKLGQGTTLYVCFMHNSIDRAPIGNMIDTMITIILSAPEIQYVYKHCKNEKEFVFDTDVIKQSLGDIPITTPEILEWIKGYMQEGLASL